MLGPLALLVWVLYIKYFKFKALVDFIVAIVFNLVMVCSLECFLSAQAEEQLCFHYIYEITFLKIVTSKP